MKNTLLKKKSFLAIIISLSAVQLFSQPQNALDMAKVETHIVKSIHTNKEYLIQVLLPHSYSVGDDVKYPVLYVLDGKYSSGLFNSTIEIFALGKELNEPIVVTIDGNNLNEPDWLSSRHHDYTPSYDPKADSVLANYFKIPLDTSGGAAAFLATFEKEIIPLIERKYKTSLNRGLFGHSLGGLFAGYCLVTRPDLFQKYSLNSPSFWWNNGQLTTKLDSLALKNPEMAVDIFISAGDLEGEFMIAPVKKFEASLRENFPKSNITSKIFDGETHLSVVPIVCSRTLRLFYAKV
jgi:predicted alpha/beta superfamily hydrolase